MDEMKIESDFMRRSASWLIEKVVRNKLGYDVEVQLNGLLVTVLDGKAHVHLDVDLDAGKEEVGKLLKSIGIGA